MSNTKQMEDKTAVEIGGALARLAELKTKKIVEKDDAAENRGLEKFLQREMVEHAEEFLGCWFTIRNQYQPLIQGFASLIMRADAVIANVRAGKAESEPVAVDNSTKEPK